MIDISLLSIIFRRNQRLEIEHIILITVIISAVLMLLVLVLNSLSLSKKIKALEDRLAGEDQLKQIKEYFDDGAGDILDQIYRQNTMVSETIKQNMDLFGDKLSVELKNLQNITEKIEKTVFELNRNISQEQEKQYRLISESMTKLTTETRESLDKINGTVNEKLQDSLDKKINDSFKTVSEQLMSVSRGLGEMQNVASNITDLKKVLSNVKTRGNFGEVQLEAILEEILSADQYEKQTNITGQGSTRVDFAIRLPGPEDGERVYLPIDAKFPGDTYSALSDALSAGNAEEAEERRKKLAATIREEAKSIHEKYIYPPKTTDFALMFLPSEGLYSEAVNMPGLVEELQRKYRVNITGPSTMAAMLSSLRMGFQTLKIRQKSAEIQKVLEAAKKEFGTFSSALNSTRDKLRRVDEDLEKLVTTRSNAINRVLKGITETEDLDTARNIIDTTV